MTIGGPRESGSELGSSLAPRLDAVAGRPPEELVRIARRRGAARSYLLVSTVLGKHIPASPAVVLATGAALGASAAAALGPVPAALVLGFAETATALGQCVADALEVDYLATTRFAGSRDGALLTVDESHSHARTHLVAPSDARWLRRPGPVVIVDDELSTGSTAMNLVRALQRLRPRAQYVVATLLDTRADDARRWMSDEAGQLGTRVSVVSLSSARWVGVPGATSVVLGEEREGATGGPSPLPPLPPPPPAAVVEVDAAWPEGVPSGGRDGLPAGLGMRLGEAVERAASRIAALVEELHPNAARLHVLGTEEFMYVPVRLAAALERGWAARAARSVVFSSTTRSPARARDAEGYGIQTACEFAPHERGSGREGTRFAYNVERADVIVLAVDETAEPDALTRAGGVVDALRSRCALLVVVKVDASPPTGRSLFGPGFSSYARQDVEWLLTDLSAVALERPADSREAGIQSGQEHYAESLPVEYEPSPQYLELLDDLVDRNALRVARSVGVLGERIAQARGAGVVLVSLARAGTPAGILVKRWLARTRGWDPAHYTISIVRGRGIDTEALDFLTAAFPARDIVFVDGWTGKGAIARELREAVRQYRADRDAPDLSDVLAVLADPGRCASLWGTRDDLLIPSACLNATVSGLVSRTVLNARWIPSGAFHGAKHYRELAARDRSRQFLDAVTNRFAEVEPEVRTLLAAAATAPTDGWPEGPGDGWAEGQVARIAARYGISDLHLVKPGVGETTRVLLRRVPYRVLVRDAGSADVEHLLVLAQAKDVPVETIPDLPFTSVGLIRPTATLASQGEFTPRG